jgi:hypothetical protein
MGYKENVRKHIELILIGRVGLEGESHPEKAEEGPWKE